MTVSPYVFEVGLIAAKAVSAVAVGVAAVSSASALEPTFLSPVLIGAAVFGSIAAELFRFINRTEPPAATMWRRAFKGLASCVLGFLFGWFMGVSVADMTGLQPISAVFVTALMGYGIITVLLSPGLMKLLSEKLKERFK